MITSYHGFSMLRKGELYPKKEGDKMGMNMEIDYQKALAFTGHRPDKLFGYDYKEEGNIKMLKRLRSLIERCIEKRGINTFITGMALGVDMWSAQIVLQLKKKYPHIKLVCAIPCFQQWKKWSQEDREIWHDIVNRADHVHHVSIEPYTKWCMQKRNEWMVDNSNLVISVWDGSEGGTYNCVKYALKRQRTTLQLHPKTLKIDFVKSIDNNKK